MSKDTIISARLDIIAAKAKILAEKYKNNQLWDGDLNRSLSDIEGEISSIKNEGNGSWATSRNDWQGDR